MSEPSVHWHSGKGDMIVVSGGMERNFPEVDMPVVRPMKIWIVEDKAGPERRVLVCPRSADGSKPVDNREQFHESCAAEHF